MTYEDTLNWCRVVLRFIPWRWLVCSRFWITWLAVFYEIMKLITLTLPPSIDWDSIGWREYFEVLSVGLPGRGVIAEPTTMDRGELILICPYSMV